MNLEAEFLDQRGQLRNEMRRVLTSLDRRWLEAAGRKLSRNLTRVLNGDIGSSLSHVLAWASHFPGEPDLSLFIDEQLELRKVYLPRCEADNRMRFFEVGVDWRNELVRGYSGIPEPAGGPEFEPSMAAQTVVIVPGLAFDIQGNRLGRGRGFYDRFLGRNSMRGIERIGAGWALQVLPKLPFASHDVAMTWLCDEQESRSIGASDE